MAGEYGILVVAAPLVDWMVPGITTYAQLAGIGLLFVAATGSAIFGWHIAAIYFHVGVGLLFLFVGYARLETTIVRQMVTGLGVLLVAVKGVTILVLVVADAVLLARPRRDQLPDSWRH